MPCFAKNDLLDKIEPMQMKFNKKWVISSLLIITLILAVGLILWFSPLGRRLEVHLDIWSTQLRVYFQPVNQEPTVNPTEIKPLATQTFTRTPAPSAAALTPIATQNPQPLPTAAPTALPGQVKLESPKMEPQDWNNCGPDTLATYLHYYGWKGTQFDISSQVKPVRGDRNTNVDELAGFVSQNVGWLEVEYRVGGNLALIHTLLAANVPVMVEETFHFDQPYWFKDDLWGGHYLLLTGYNDSSHTLLTQDSDRGADRWIDEQAFDGDWQAFNRVYILVFPPGDEQKISSILGSDWDIDQNRRNALELSRKETQNSPADTFAWFNLGTNLVYFKQYDDAAAAYDQARAHNMPQRMLRYQFGPFLAYFQSGRMDDLTALVDYALKVTPNSEEANLWKGWSLFRQGKKAEAQAAFNQAIQARPGYPDAEYALTYVKSH